MQITGITIIKRIKLQNVENDNTTGFFKLFMEYCIDNHRNQIVNSEQLMKYFKLTGEYPNFNRAIHYDRVIEYNGLYYTDWLASKDKKRYIEKISEILQIETTISTVD